MMTIHAPTEVEVTADELATVLRRLAAPTPATVELLTAVDRLRKPQDAASRPWAGALRKRSVREVLLAFWYEGAVNERREAEGKPADFEACPHLYADHEPEGALSRHRRARWQLYLPMLVTAESEPAYESLGRPVAADLVGPWLITRAEGSRQGLDQPLVYRNPKIESVTKLLTGGVLYTVLTREKADPPCSRAPRSSLPTTSSRKR